jgi:hypothetical protein
MKKTIGAGAILLLFFFLLGCMSYRMGDETFDSPSAALQKQKDVLSGRLAQIKASENQIGGTALIAVPSDNEIRRNYLKASLRTSQESVDFVIAGMRNTIQFDVDVIVKRRLFDSVDIVHHNGSPASYPIGGNDFLMYLDVDGWFIKGKNKSSLLPISADKKLAGIQRIEAFLEEIYNQAKILQKKQ